jgi:molybdate transport system permease protein
MVDWDALWLSLRLAGATVLVLLPVAIAVGRWIAASRWRWRGLVEASLALPLVLPPTVVGYYLLVGFGGGSWFGRLYDGFFGGTLMFTFEALLLASVLVNLPFAIQPVQRAFEAIPPDVRDAAACCGMSPSRRLWRIELPLAWPGILTGMVLTFAHTLGEFGVVLMVGGSIPGETKTIAIAIYDRVQAFDEAGAGRMATLLLAISVATIAASYMLSHHIGRRYG